MRTVAVVSMFVLVSATPPSRGGGVLSANTQGDGQPRFRSTTELVVMTVTVQQSSGGYVSSLGRDNFTIYEDGRPQPIALFSSDDVPVDVALVVDTSSSVSDQIPLARQAAITLANGLSPADRVAVFSFDQQTRLEQPFTSDRLAIERALGQVHGSSTTAYYDAMNVVLQSFKGAGSEVARRRAIVVLSDGEDTASMSTYEDVLDRARRLGVAIYTVALRSAPAANHSAVLRRTSESAFELRALAFETGARAFTLTARNDLRGAYQSIAEELGHQYSIAFVPGVHVPGRFTRVRIDVDQPGLQVRARTGYIASGAHN